MNKDNAIVSNKKITSLSTEELHQLHEDVVEITATYEDASDALDILNGDMFKLKNAGERYNEIARKVNDKLIAIKAKGIIGKVE